MLGPEMPSAELLAAAAKLTEAQTELRYFIICYEYVFDHVIFRSKTLNRHICGTAYFHLFYISREAELEEDDELFVGPPPPAMVAEAETANEAERFEEVCFTLTCCNVC